MMGGFAEAWVNDDSIKFLNAITHCKQFNIHDEEHLFTLYSLCKDVEKTRVNVWEWWNY